MEIAKRRAKFLVPALLAATALALGIFLILHNFNQTTGERKIESSNAELIASGNYRDDFEIDVVLKSEGREIHHTSYIPENIESQEEVKLYITLPGWEGLYFQGAGANLVEDFYWRAKDLNPDLIILAPQLDDWGDQSAKDTILLTKFYKEKYKVDKIYINGLSGGGETLSLVLDKEPELYTRALMVSSQWDGGIEKLVQAKTPVYFFTGENDSYYGSQNFKETYSKIYQSYEAQGLEKAEIDSLVVLDIRSHEYFTAHGLNDEHMGANLASHEDSIMKWLLEL